MSEKGGISLWRLLVRGVWFVIRLIILLATDTWIGDEDERPGGKSRPGMFNPQKTQPAQAGSLRTADAIEAAERFVRRGERAEALARSGMAGDGLARWLDEAVIAPVRQRLARAKAGDVRALLELARIAPAHDSTLIWVIRALDARRTSQPRPIFADLEEVASGLSEPIRALAGDGVVRVRARRFVALPEGSAIEREARPAGGLVIPLRVAPDVASDPRRWPLLAHDVARALLEDVEGWLDELRGKLGFSLPARMPLLPTPSGYERLTGEALLGPWLLELMSDVLATFMLGPSYASELCAQLSNTVDAQRAAAAQAEGRWLSPVPPARLRIHAVLRTLEELGFEADASALRRQFELARSQAPLLLPSLDGAYQPVPFRELTEPLDALISLAIQEPNMALGERTWLDVSGLGFSHGEQGAARAAQGALTRGEKVSLPTRVLLAACWLALSQRSTAKENVLGALLRSIRGGDVIEQAVAQVPSPRRRAPRVVQLRDLVSDPHAIRDAVILGAVFSPPRSAHRALSKR